MDTRARDFESIKKRGVSSRALDISAISPGYLPLWEGVEIGATPLSKQGFMLANRIAFERLWISINGPDSWQDNPWVVALSFDVAKQNIDDTHEQKETG